MGRRANTTILKKARRFPRSKTAWRETALGFYFFDLYDHPAVEVDELAAREGEMVLVDRVERLSFASEDYDCAVACFGHFGAAHAALAFVAVVMVPEIGYRGHRPLGQSILDRVFAQSLDCVWETSFKKRTRRLLVSSDELVKLDQVFLGDLPTSPIGDHHAGGGARECVTEEQ